MEPARLEALSLAVEKAAQEARTIAAALGVQLGRPLEVRGGAQVPTPMPLYEARAMAVEAPTPVEPAEQTVSATVTVRYSIVQPSR